MTKQIDFKQTGKVKEIITKLDGGGYVGVSVSGPPLSGKTTLGRKVVEKLRSDGRRAAFIDVEKLGIIRDDSFTDHAVNTFARTVAQETGASFDPLREYSGRMGPCGSGFANALETIGQQTGDVVIVLDMEHIGPTMDWGTPGENMRKFDSASNAIVNMWSGIKNADIRHADRELPKFTPLLLSTTGWSPYAHIHTDGFGGDHVSSATSLHPGSKAVRELGEVFDENGLEIATLILEYTGWNVGHTVMVAEDVREALVTGRIETSQVPSFMQDAARIGAYRDRVDASIEPWLKTDDPYETQKALAAWALVLQDKPVNNREITFGSLRLPTTSGLMQYGKDGTVEPASQFIRDTCNLGWLEKTADRHGSWGVAFLIDDFLDTRRRIAESVADAAKLAGGLDQ